VTLAFGFSKKWSQSSSWLYRLSQAVDAPAHGELPWGHNPHSQDKSAAPVLTSVDQNGACVPAIAPVPRPLPGAKSPRRTNAPWPALRRRRAQNRVEVGQHLRAVAGVHMRKVNRCQIKTRVQAGVLVPDLSLHQPSVPDRRSHAEHPA
jgi:hypothetical protein